jgi:hypothetical protein
VETGVAEAAGLRAEERHPLPLRGFGWSRDRGARRNSGCRTTLPASSAAGVRRKRRPTGRRAARPAGRAARARHRLPPLRRHRGVCQGAPACAGARPTDRGAGDAVGVAKALPLHRLCAHVHQEARATGGASAGDRPLPGAWPSAWSTAPRRSRAWNAPAATGSRGRSPTARTGARRATTGRDGCRWMRPITAAVTSWPPWSLTWSEPLSDGRCPTSATHRQRARTTRSPDSLSRLTTEREALVACGTNTCLDDQAPIDGPQHSTDTQTFIDVLRAARWVAGIDRSGDPGK